MNTLLQILGSIASIGTIPLAIYLYLRSKEAKFNKIKRNIVKILSYQIGEGRNLSNFEIQSVIDSKSRENGIKSNTIYVSEIVEDLVSETISSPMLDTGRKQEILENLKNIHKKGIIYNIIDKFKLTYKDILKGIQKFKELTPEESKLIEEKIPETKVEKYLEKPKRIKKISGIYAIIAVFVSILGFLLSIFDLQITDSLSNIFKNKEILFEITLGIIATIIAVVITALLIYFKSKIIFSSVEKWTSEKD